MVFGRSKYKNMIYLKWLYRQSCRNWWCIINGVLCKPMTQSFIKLRHLPDFIPLFQEKLFSTTLFWLIMPIFKTAENSLIVGNSLIIYINKIAHDFSGLRDSGKTWLNFWIHMHNRLSWSFVITNILTFISSHTIIEFTPQHENVHLDSGTRIVVLTQKFVLWK